MLRLTGRLRRNRLTLTLRLVGLVGARGSWGSVFQARVVHASRLIDFKVEGSCVSWLEARAT